MRIFDETKTNEIVSPDLEKGYLKEDKLLIAHHEAQAEVQQQSHYEVIAEYENGGQDLEEVIDVEYQPAKDAWDEYEDIFVYVPYTKEQMNQVLNNKYIPSVNESVAVFAKEYLRTNAPRTLSAKLAVSGLYDTWTADKYEVGDIRNYAGQTWECHQAHDNAVYPDINPDNLQTWATFWHPLHGESVETARPWTKPWAGTTDMYHKGEYMVYTDGKVYKCVSDTVYSPEEYAQAWELQK